MEEVGIMAEENRSQMDSENWRKFLGRHWKVVALFAVGAILVLIGAIYFFLWFVSDAQSTGLVPASLALWTMGHLVTFLLNLIFWEILLIGIPVIIGAIAGWMWWKKLPIEERKEYRFFGKRTKAASGGNGFSLLLFIVFCIKISLDGKWNVPISTWTFDYLVNSMIVALVSILIIFGIPAAIGIIWWINHEMKKKA